MRPRSPELNLRKTILSILSPLPLVLLLSACTADSATSDWQKVEQSAQQAASAGKNTDAEQLHLTAIQKAEHVVDPEPLVTSLIALSDFYVKTGQPEKCRDLLVRALAISEKQLSDGKDKTETWRLLSAQGSLNLANVYRDQGSFPDAETLYRRAVELTPETTGGAYELSTKVRKDYKQMQDIRQYGDGHFDEVIQSRKNSFGRDRSADKKNHDERWLADEGLELSPASAKVESELCGLFALTKKLYDVRDGKYRMALQKLVLYYNRQSDYKKSIALIEEDEKQFRSIEKLTRAEAEEDPEKDLDATILSEDLSMLADMACKQGQMNKSAEYMKRAITLRERWGTPDLVLVQMHRSMSNLDCVLHKPESAMQNLEQALEALDSVEKHSRNKYWETREQIFLGMAALEKSQGSFQEAARHLAEAHTIFDRHPEGNPDFYSLIVLEEAELARAMANKKQQKVYLDVAVAYWSKNKPKDAYNKWLCLQRLAMFQYSNYEYALALKTFQQSYKLALSNPKMSVQSDAVIDTLQWIGNTEVRLNQAAAAEGHYKEALERSKKRTLENLNGTANLLMNQANLEQQIGRLDQAQSSYKNIITVCEKDREHCYETQYYAMTHLADIQTWTGHPATARDIDAKAYELVKNHKDRPDLIVRSLTRQGSDALFDGDIKQARKHFQNAETTMAEENVSDPLLHIPIFMTLSELYWLTGEKAKCEAAEDRAKNELRAAALLPENSLWDWNWDQSSRWHFKPVTTYPISAGQSFETAQALAKVFKNKGLQGFWPACCYKYVATLLKWKGASKEAQQVEQLGRAWADTAVKSQPLR